MTDQLQATPQETWQQKWERQKRERAERAAKRERQKTQPSKFRKGFPVLLKSGQALGIQAGYSWLKARGKTTPGMDAAITLIPDPQPDERTGNQTLRIRGDQIKNMIELLEAVCPFVDRNYVIHERVRDLKKITDIDALMDATR